MDHTYWHKQTDKPLFGELEWNKPERRDQAGRLLIIGGYLHNLNAPAQSYEIVTKQGIGSVKVALPDKTKRLLGSTLDAAVFLPSTASGELSREGLDELLEYSGWADTILLPGDVGRNSQTTLLISDLIENTTAQLIITRDAVDILQNAPEIIAKREKTTLLLSFAQLQKLCQNLKLPTALVFSMDLIKMIEFLHHFTEEYPCSIVTLHQNNLIVAVNGKVSTTHLPGSEISWRPRTSAISACYHTWNPTKPFEALTHSAFLTNL